MNSQIIVGGSVKRSGEKRQMFVAATGAALALAVAAGLGAWRAAEHGHTTVTTPPVTSQATSDVRPGNVEPPIVYVVSSQAQADAIQAGIEKADNIRVVLHEAPLNQRILLAGMADVEQQLSVITEENHTRAALGLPLIQIVDLRES